MPDYRVKWEIDIEANSPVEAARLAREMHKDPDSTATFFTVIDPDNNTHDVEFVPDEVIVPRELRGIRFEGPIHKGENERWTLVDAHSQATFELSSGSVVEYKHHGQWFQTRMEYSHEPGRKGYYFIDNFTPYRGLIVRIK